MDPAPHLRGHYTQCIHRLGCQDVENMRKLLDVSKEGVTGTRPA